MAQSEIIYINFTGGIVSPGYLQEVLKVAASAKVTTVRFGQRQQLILEVPVRNLATFIEDCAERKIVFEFKKHAHPNIISSYAVAGIFTNDSWLREGVYKDVFNSFDYMPKVKVN